MEKKSVLVQCLPTQQDKQGSFHQHQMAVKKDLERKLQQRGVPVVTDFKTDPAPEVFVLFQSVGRVGDELPCALQDLPQDTRERVTAFAVIQDDEYHKVGREVLPSDFQPQHLLDFVVVPGTSRLKDCVANNEVLDQIAQHAGGVPGASEVVNTVERKTVFVQCWPIQKDKDEHFHRQQMAVREDLVRKLEQRGVTVETDIDQAPESLVLFQPGCGPPSVPPNLRENIREKVKAVAVIQDDEHPKVGREVLPSDFQSVHLLNFVVVPGTKELKDCAANNAVLDQIAMHAGGSSFQRKPRRERNRPGSQVMEVEPARKKEKIEEKSRIIGFVQCLPTQQDKQGSFHQHQMAVKEDLEMKLRQRGVTVENEFKDTDPTLEVLVLFQSVGRVGDELPSALQDLPPNIKDKVKGFAVIQDDEHHRVGREVLPPDFQPHLLDFVVVPGTSRLKDCAANNEVLDQIAQYTGAVVAKVEAASSLGGPKKRAPSQPTDTNRDEPPRCTLL